MTARAARLAVDRRREGLGRGPRERRDRGRQHQVEAGEERVQRLGVEAAMTDAARLRRDGNCLRDGTESEST